jgi:small subunit ribosomal protein S24e
LLNRKQFVVTVLHPTRANLSRDELSDKLAALYKTEKKRVVVFGLKTKFGGASSQGFGLIYDDEESQRKFEPKYRLVRVRPNGSARGACSSRTLAMCIIHATKTDQSARNGREGPEGLQEAQEGAKEPIQEGMSIQTLSPSHGINTNAQVRGTAKAKAGEPSKKK